MHNEVIFSIFVIFVGSAILATLALYARQALIIAYIVLGVLVGPSGLKLITNMHLIESIADIGIIFLLFLLGLHLEPQDLLKMLKKTTFVTVISSIAFAVLGILTSLVFQFSILDSILIGTTMMFSSTILGLKLLPTTVLHHKRAGEIMVSVLLLQDLIAITMLLMLKGVGTGNSLFIDIALMLLSLPLLVGIAWVIERFLLSKLLQRFDRIQEYIFLLTIAWCLGMAELANMLKASHEIGAFIGGVTLATHPLARFIAESLKPLRDFFLVLFFFYLGASLQLDILYDVLLPSIILAAIMLLAKPWVFYALLVRLEEKGDLALEMGVRLGQISEFALLITVVALTNPSFSHAAIYLIQATTILTFVFSSYYIVMTYPTPIAASDKLRRD